MVRMFLTLSSLAFTYSGASHPALRPCSLELDTSVITVLVGNNGAGKSTLIRLLTGQLLGFQGTYLLDGARAEPLKGELLARYRFGYVPDIPVLDPLLTGAEAAEMAGSFRGMDRARILGELEAYAALFDLGDWYGGLTCDKYSKGMRKKAALVIGFLGEPQYVFLDEPFDGLDPVAIYHLKRHLKDRRARGLGCLVSSHMLDAAEKVADELIIMKDGNTVYTGGFKALLDSRPAGAALDEIYFEYFAK
ncbi:MAG: ABC transporter ATP-binding protein [Fibrobacteria bacterium]